MAKAHGYGWLLPNYNKNIHELSLREVLILFGETFTYCDNRYINTGPLLNEMERYLNERAAKLNDDGE